MYARLVTFSLVPGERPAAEKGADEFAKVCRTLKGFNSLTLLINEGKNGYGGLSLWQTEQDAEAAMVTLQRADRTKWGKGQWLIGPSTARHAFARRGRPSPE